MIAFLNNGVEVYNVLTNFFAYKSKCIIKVLVYVYIIMVYQKRFFNLKTCHSLCKWLYCHIFPWYLELYPPTLYHKKKTGCYINKNYVVISLPRFLIMKVK